MIGTIRKHSQWLWAVIITVVIISFVLFFSPDAKLKGRGTGDFGTINGRKIHRLELVEGYREAQLSFFLRFNQWPKQDEMSRRLGFEPDMEARRLLVFNEAMRDLGIYVSDRAVVAQLQRFFRDTNGVYQSQYYQNFVNTQLRQNGLGADDLERFVRHEIGRYHLARVFGMSGKLATPRAAEAFYRREHEQVLTEAVFFANTNQLAQVVLEPKALLTFYTNQLANYRVPERVQVSYVQFATHDFLADAAKQMATLTNLATQIETEYAQRGTNSFKDKDGKVLSADAAKEKMREDVRTRFARQAAEKQAVEFANELFRMEPMSVTNLLALAAKKGVKVKATEPFGFEGPKGNFPEEFGSTAFKLSAAEPLTTPLSNEDGTFIMAFKERFASKPSPYSDVKDKVTEDFKKSQAQELTMLAATKLHKAVTNGLAQGKTFKAICAENNFKSIDVPAITRASRELAPAELKGVDFREYRETAFGLPVRQVSSYSQTSDGGMLIFNRALVPVAEEKVKAELAEYAEQLRESRVNSVFNDWFTREWEQTGMAAQTKRPASAE